MTRYQNQTRMLVAVDCIVFGVDGQHLKIYFNQSGTVSQIEGLETIPKTQQGLPGSKEAILTAPPL